jgi:hypothetical protein
VFVPATTSGSVDQRRRAGPSRQKIGDRFSGSRLAPSRATTHSFGIRFGLVGILLEFRQHIGLGIGVLNKSRVRSRAQFGLRSCPAGRCRGVALVSSRARRCRRRSGAAREKVTSPIRARHRALATRLPAKIRRQSDAASPLPRRENRGLGFSARRQPEGLVLHRSHARSEPRPADGTARQRQFD